jgi:hypothetical protein
LGPVKWTYYYLYVLLDIFRRFVVGWLLARQESAALGKELIAESCGRQHIGPDQQIVDAFRVTVRRPISCAIVTTSTASRSGAESGACKSRTSSRPRTALAKSTTVLTTTERESEAQFRLPLFLLDRESGLTVTARRSEDAGSSYLQLDGSRTFLREPDEILAKHRGGSCCSPTTCSTGPETVGTTPP